MASSPDDGRILVGVRTVTHVGGVVRLERKRWERFETRAGRAPQEPPPGTNRRLEVSDGTTTAWATMGRRRATRVVAALEAAGHVVEPR